MFSEEEKQVWAGFASAALSGIMAAGTAVRDDDELDEDEADLVAAEAACVADAMLAEFNGRIETRRPRRKRGETE